MHPETDVEISSNVDLLAKLLSIQTGLQKIYLSSNFFSENATKVIVTAIADNPSTIRNLKKLNI